MAADKEVDQRARCWALGVELTLTAENLLEAADRASDFSATAGGEPLHAPSVQRAGDEANRVAILYWAEKFDRELTQAEACGIEKNGYLGGEFGRYGDWAGTRRLDDLIEMGRAVIRVTHEQAEHILKGED
jgi:hypothetical protein